MKEAIIKLHQLQVLVLALVGVLFFTSCATSIPPYYPKISLDVSPQMIKKTVRFDGIVDVSPEKDKTKPFAGFSVTNPKVLATDLELEVTNEIVNDFSENKLFQDVSRNADEPDYIIKGEIKKFKGISKGKTSFLVGSLVCMVVGYGLLSYAIATPTSPYILGIYVAGGLIVMTPAIASFLGVNSSTIDVEIEIVLYVYDRNNNLVGTYSGKENYIEDVSLKKGLREKYTPAIVGEKTNKTFSSVVMQIREQIVRDKKNILN